MFSSHVDRRMAFCYIVCRLALGSAHALSAFGCNTTMTLLKMTIRGLSVEPVTRAELA